VTRESSLCAPLKRRVSGRCEDRSVDRREAGQRREHVVLRSPTSGPLPQARSTARSARAVVENFIQEIQHRPPA
jgi:hypothetical protein